MWPNTSCTAHDPRDPGIIRQTRLTEGTDGSVTFGWGGQPAASRCSCSEAWLEKRSEQHTAQPSLFIREEMMLQPQPHIDLLINGPRRVRRRGDGQRGGKKPNRRVCKLKPLPGRCCDSPSPHSWSLLWSVFHMVLSHRYSINESRPTSPAVNATQILILASIHANLHHWAHFSGPFHSWLLPTYSPPYAVLSLNSAHLPLWKHSHPQNTFLWCWK